MNARLPEVVADGRRVHSENSGDLWDHQALLNDQGNRPSLEHRREPLVRLMTPWPLLLHLPSFRGTSSRCAGCPPRRITSSSRIRSWWSSSQPSATTSTSSSRSARSAAGSVGFRCFRNPRGAPADVVKVVALGPRSAEVWRGSRKAKKCIPNQINRLFGSQCVVEASDAGPVCFQVQPWVTLCRFDPWTGHPQIDTGS